MNSRWLSVRRTAFVALFLTFALAHSLCAQGSASIRGRTLDSLAISRQLASLTMLSVISAEKLQELPEASVAVALSRLPGMTLVYGEGLVMRGIQGASYRVTMNGFNFPSTDMNSRATDLDYLPPLSMLSGLEVERVLTPDRDASTLGGIINIRLQEAPIGGMKLHMQGQGGYNTQDRTKDNNNFWMSLSDRFFSERLGIVIQGRVGRTNGGADHATASYGAVRDNAGAWSYGQMERFTFKDDVDITDKTDAHVLVDYTLPHGKIVLQSSYANRMMNNISYINTLSFLNNTGFEITADHSVVGKDVLTSALKAENMFGSTKVELALAHSYTDQYTRMQYSLLNPSPVFTEDRFNPSHTGNRTPSPYSQVPKFLNDALGSDGRFDPATLTLDDVLKIQLNRQIGETSAERIDDYIRLYDLLARDEYNFRQHTYSFSVDISTPLSISSSVSSVIKAGGRLSRMVHVNDVNYFVGGGGYNYFGNVSTFFGRKPITNFNPVPFSLFRDTEYPAQRGRYFLDGKFPFTEALNIDVYDRFIKQATAGPQRASANKDQDFKGAELLAAGYVMGTFSLGPRLTILGGVRVEQNTMNYQAPCIISYHYFNNFPEADIQIDSLSTDNRIERSVLPNLQVRYQVATWADIRASYSQGISRPEYLAIASRKVQFVSYEQTRPGFAGNPALKPALSTNLDLTLSLYHSNAGLFTISPFFKKVTNLSYQTQIFYQNLGSYGITYLDPAFFHPRDWKGILPPKGTDLITTYLNNPNPGTISGVEFSWQSALSYLPKPLNSLLIDVSYTKSWSDMAYHKIQNRMISVRDTTGSRTIFRTVPVTTDSICHTRLPYQPDDVLNIALGVEYKGFSGRLSFRMQGRMLTEITNVAVREEDVYTNATHRWDVTLKQDLPLEGLSVLFEGVNMFNTAVTTYQTFKSQGSRIATDHEQALEYYPSFYTLTLRYSM